MLYMEQSHLMGLLLFLFMFYIIICKFYVILRLPSHHEGGLRSLCRNYKNKISYV